MVVRVTTEVVPRATRAISLLLSMKNETNMTLTTSELGM
jgi:hypothetical protein